MRLSRFQRLSGFVQSLLSHNVPSSYVVEPQRTVVVPLHIEDVRIVVRVRIVRRAICATAHRILSGLYRICDLKSSGAAHQVSSFFEVSSYTTPSRIVIRNVLDVWILDSAAGSRDRPHIRLLPRLVYQKKSSRADLARGSGFRGRRGKRKGARGKEK